MARHKKKKRGGNPPNSDLKAGAHQGTPAKVDPKDPQKGPMPTNMKHPAVEPGPEQHAGKGRDAQIKGHSKHKHHLGHRG
jgi:hypothetical protein